MLSKVILWIIIGSSLAGAFPRWLKVYGYISGGTTPVHIFTFASLISGGLLLKERICSLGSKVFPLRSDPIWEGFIHPGKAQIGRQKSCSPL